MIHKNSAGGLYHENKIIQKILAEEANQPDLSLEVTFSFEVCIDIGDGRKGTILVDQKSDPLLCALQFCHDYCLDEVIAGILCQSIKEKIDNQRKSTQKSLSIQKRQKVSQSFMYQNRDGFNHNTNEDSSLRDITALHNMRNSMNVSRSGLTRSKSKPRTQSQQIIAKQIEHDFSYKPKINEISQIIVQKLNKKSIVDEVELNKRKKQVKIERMKKQMQQKQISQCSFKPKINIISQRVDNEIKRQHSGTKNKRYEQLYRHSFVAERNRQFSRNKSIENLTFKPQINKHSKNMVSGLNFQQRQEKFKGHKNESGQVNPVPRTGRGPRNRDTKGMSIGEYLYQKSKSKRQKIPAHPQHPERKVIALGKSQQLVCKLKEQRLSEIFGYFDQNNDGKIRYQEIDESIIDPQIMQIFLPILQQMRELNIELDRAEFIQASQRLLESLSPQQRNSILNTRKKPQFVQTYSFKVRSKLKQPNINKKSQQLSAVNTDLYTRGLVDKKKLRQKAQREREQQARVQLNQCSFKPKIIKYSNPIYSTLN